MNIDHPSAYHVPSLRSLWKEAFGDTDRFLDDFFGTAFSYERTLCIYEGEEVRAALYWFDCEYSEGKLAYIYAVATANAYRGKGLCRALTDRLHALLCERGYVGSLLVPGSKELFSFYERLGYEICSSISEREFAAKRNTFDFRIIDRNEYADLRRRLIPAGGVIQENENLAFLDTQAEFCAGDDLLLAFRRKNGRVYGLELLGDASFAPMLCDFLGCGSGKFRIPGDEMPFGMFSSAGDKKTPPPSYFGLAFD